VVFQDNDPTNSLVAILTDSYLLRGNLANQLAAPLEHILFNLLILEPNKRY